MRIISKNAETIALLCIIFYIYFSLVVLYETKINTLESDIEKYVTDVSEKQEDYFKDVDGFYYINFTYLERINTEYIKVSFNNNFDIIRLDSNLISALILNANYDMLLEKTSDTEIKENNLEQLIEKNRVKSVARVG